MFAVGQEVSTKYGLGTVVSRWHRKTAYPCPPTFKLANIHSEYVADHNG